MLANQKEIEERSLDEFCVVPFDSEEEDEDEDSLRGFASDEEEAVAAPAVSGSTVVCATAAPSRAKNSFAECVTITPLNSVVLSGILSETHF